MGSLTGKVAWVTGAGSGIGLAASLALAQAGAHVTLSGRGRDALAGAQARIRECEGSATVEPLDVSDAAAVSAVGERIEAEHQRLDILVNNAGVNLPKKHWAELSTKQFAQVIEINLNGATYCTAAVLPMMRRQKDGLVINISSWAGRFDEYLPGPAYNASKHGMNALSASLNIEECVNGIRSCAICPGEVATPILMKRPIPPTEEELAAMLQPEDLGGVVLFLAELPSHVCINEILISPTWNRIYLGGKGLGRPISKTDG